MKQTIQAIQRDLIEQLNKLYLGKSEIVDLLAVTLVAGENLFLLGPPGTAKSALVSSMAQILGLPKFEYLLTRFTEPNEIFGPFDIRKLREGELVTNTEGMLPEASFVFLDELLNANSAILNGLLMILNERRFARGRESWDLPALMVVGASNHLPEDQALRALFDRFLLRGYCDNIATENLPELLKRGWQLEKSGTKLQHSTLTAEDLKNLQRQVQRVSMDAVLGPYAELVIALRRAGVELSDRRIVKLQRCIAASALLCLRSQARVSDLWVLRHIWGNAAERELIAEIVDEFVGKDLKSNQEAKHHAAAQSKQLPNPEKILAGIEGLEQAFKALRNPDSKSTGASLQNERAAKEVVKIQNKLGRIFEKIQYVRSEQSAQFLNNKAQSLFNSIREYQRN